MLYCVLKHTSRTAKLSFLYSFSNIFSSLLVRSIAVLFSSLNFNTMPHSFGVRARTRHMFAKTARKHGLPGLSQYLMNVKVGDYVDIFADSAIHKGMPFKFYHGRTGIVFNLTKSSVGVRVNKFVNGRIIEKRIHVRIEHIRKSKCQQEILARKLRNESLKAAARAGGEKADLKRHPVKPKAGYFLAAPGDTELVTIQPLPFSDLV
jgi:large subunit ribosomal protein L21e